MLSLINRLNHNGNGSLPFFAASGAKLVPMISCVLSSMPHKIYAASRSLRTAPFASAEMLFPIVSGPCVVSLEFDPFRFGRQFAQLANQIAQVFWFASFHRSCYQAL